MRNILNKQSKLWMFRHVKIVIKLATYRKSSIRSRPSIILDPKFHGLVVEEF